MPFISTARNLVAGDELGGEVEAVHAGGVGDVLSPVLDGALAGGNGLHVEAEHGEHGEPPVLDLLHLELGEGVGVISQSEGVEGLARVEAVEALAGGPAVHTVALNQAHEEHLGEHDGQDGLRVHQGGVAEVVEATLGEDLAAGLEPDGLAEAHAAVLGEQLGGEAAEGAEHGPAGVDQLLLAVAAEGLGVGGEAGGVPAVVAGELAGQVGGGGVLGEGAEPLGTVGAIPLDSGAGDLLGATLGDGGLASHGGGEGASGDGSHVDN